MRTILKCAATALLSALLVATAATTLAAPGAAAQSAPATTSSLNFTVCGFNVWYGGVPWGMTAMRAYPEDFPGATFNFRIINSGDWLRGVVQAYLAEGAGCDVLTLIGYSPYCLALSPLVSETVAWVDGSSTSTDLSDKISNPYFNRVIPTDAVGAGGAATFVASQGWKLASVICLDDSYGRSVAEGFSYRLNTLGGTIEFSRCLAPSFTAEDMDATLTEILSRSQSQVIFMAGSFGQPGIDGINRNPRARTAALIFTESMCSDNWLSQVPGAFCAGYGINAAAAAYAQQAYNTRDVAAEVRDYGPLLDYAAGDTSYEIDFWAAMVMDATRAGMKAAYGYRTANRTQYPTMSDYVRSVTFTGITGYVSFDANGDRVDSVLNVFNSQPSAANASLVELNQVGVMDNGTVSFSASRLYYRPGGGQWANPATPPSGLRPEEAASAAFPIWAIVVIVIAVVAIGAVAVVASRGGAATRDNSVAPKDATVPFTIMFTDIQSSTTQWAVNAEAMGPAVDQHHDVIRRILRGCNGYEVKTIGDSFMVAFADPADAVVCAVRIQQELFAQSWSPDIDTVYRKSDETAMTDAAYRELWCGLRVRVGVHTGQGSIKLDPVTQGYDYYGTVVNTAARVEGVGHGGQVLVTAATYAALNATARGKAVLSDNITAQDLGPQPLRGLNEPVSLVQLVPAEFAGRQFPPLRLDVEINVEDDETDDAQQQGIRVQGDSHSSASSRQTRDGPDGVIQLAARRTMMPSQELQLYYKVVKAVYAPLPKKDRSKAVADLAKRWRVSTDNGQRGDAAIDTTIAQIAVKAVGVVATLTNGENTGGLLVPRTGSGRGGSGLMVRSVSGMHSARRAGDKSPAPQSVTPGNDAAPGVTIDVPRDDQYKKDPVPGSAEESS